MRLSRIYKISVVINVLAMSLLGAGCNGSDTRKSHDNGKEQITNMEDLYPVIFGDPARTSFIDARSSSKGEVGWEIPLNDKASPPFGPRAILVSGRQLFVYSDSMLSSFNTEGKLIWSRPIRPESPVGIAGGNIYFRKKDKIDLIQGVTLAGQDLPGTYWLLESDISCRPIYFQPLDSDFLSVSLCIGPPEGQPPVSIPYRKKYETESYLWSDQVNGTPPLAPLYIISLNRFILFAQEEVVVYNAAKTDWQADIFGRFKYPFEKIIQAGADKNGTIYLIGVAEGKINLVTMSSQGEEMWRWIGGSPDSYPSAQPPIIGIDGLVHLPFGRTLNSIKNGSVVREFSIEKKLITYCTALADGSILIVAEDELHRVDGEGKQIYGLAFEHRLLTPPVIDQNGNVYVATADSLIRIE
ncbi:exported hypothetical protein [Candidatus Zixiibacteriota bacterium]|nr:exported hypothetical protein [candidate division Zixibacteria bacterium]